MLREFIVIDLVKGALLRRMERETGIILNDTFLSPQRRCFSVVLYEEVGDNFVKFIRSLHTVKNVAALFTAANYAVLTFNDNLNICWAMTYNPKFETKNKMKWL